MKIIDMLLRLYPEDFRARFGEDMRAFHEERMRERRRSLIGVVVNHVGAALREQAHALGPDVRSALRSLRNRPTFGAVVILTVALGVGANGAIFSIVNGVLFRSLFYPEADRVISLTHRPTQWLVSEPQFAVYRDRLPAFQSLAAFNTGEGNLATDEEPERVAFASVTANFFATLGVQPMLGRGFAESDVVRPAASVILSHGLWAQRFASDSAIVGRSIRLNGIERTVIGVMPAGFEHPSPRTRLWLPICSQRTCASLLTQPPTDADGWNNHYLFAVGRLRGGATLEEAGRQATDLARAIMREHPDNFDSSMPLVPVVQSIRDEMVGKTRPYLVALLGAVAFVLLIVCANVANLLLARGNGRRREMALRAAIGASRRRLVIQLLTEAMVLSLIGGLLGLPLAWGGSRILVALAPESLPRLDQVRMDVGVIAYSIAVALVAGVIFGVIPAFRQGRDTPADALRSGGRGQGRQAGSARTRHALVVAEIAVAVVLLAGAGMLTRSLITLQQTDIGFRPAGVFTARVSVSGSGYDDGRTIAFFEDLVSRVRAIPRVNVAGAARWLPVVDAGGQWDIRIEGRNDPPGQPPLAVPQEVTPGFFPAMGMPLLAGRDFTDRDRIGALPVAIVNRALTRLYLAGEDPLGRRFRLGGKDSAWVTIVGVVSDLQARGPGDVPEPSMYFPVAQLPVSGYYVPRSFAIVARTAGDPSSLAVPIRNIVRAMDANVPVSSLRTLDAVVATATANRRFSTELILAFAIIAAILAGIGIYGVMSYAVAERTYEIGLRVALGANVSTVLRLILGLSARLAGLGLVLGLIGAMALGRVMRALLVDASAIDVPVLLGVAASLAAIAMVAAFLPAWRAAKIPPREALRSA